MCQGFRSISLPVFKRYVFVVSTPSSQFLQTLLCIHSNVVIGNITMWSFEKLRSVKGDIFDTIVKFMPLLKRRSLLVSAITHRSLYF